MKALRETVTKNLSNINRMRLFETNLQKGVDHIEHRPYRPVHRSSAALQTASNATVASKFGQQSPGFYIGEASLSALFVVWLFDIVGFR
jgi:hypothetical protein